MPIAYFDPFSGASGDMTLGALVDAGLSIDTLRDELERLDLSGYEIIAEQTEQHGITGTRVRVLLTQEDHHHRHWSDIREMIESSALRDGTKRRALHIFQGLAEAEARVHNMPVDDVHFHEVGAVDSIVDIVGAAAGLEILRIEQVYANTLRDGTGFVRAAHGVLPVPAPATAELIAMAGAPLRPHDIESELLTPTGAAILTRLATFERPEFQPTAIGYGFGSRELPWPNALRVWIGELATGGHAPQSFAGEQDLQPHVGEHAPVLPRSIGEPGSTTDEPPLEILLETNIDDMNPEFYEPLMDLLFQHGAFDVYLTPITMKRGRPATKVSVISDLGHRDTLESLLMEHTTTLGVRMTPIERRKAGRRIETVTTRWGEVRVKLKIWDGRVTDAAPEYVDCYAIVQQHEVPIRLVYGEVSRIAEAFIGRQVDQQNELSGWRL
jgi:pyridinium-3,5-bisthiocarboxylic acid mononucleotide nickel chelatase